MSTREFQGRVYAFQVFMRQAQAEIDRGDRSGAKVLYDKPARKVRQRPVWWRALKARA